ncbi:hypothetical protein L1887_31058 [Cichorium endivia]|nr:hypothetical protein L1887_31058 [Cichorium endivia]
MLWCLLMTGNDKVFNTIFTSSTKIADNKNKRICLYCRNRNSIDIDVGKYQTISHLNFVEVMAIGDVVVFVSTGGQVSRLKKLRSNT